MDDFATFDASKWIVSTWTAPGNNATNVGSFSASNVTIVDNSLCLKLSQTLKSGKNYSVGSEITSKQALGYGTYEFEMRASSTAARPGDIGVSVSGSITGCFNYLDGSKTEIDIEVEGGIRSALVQCTSWIGESLPSQQTNFTPALVPFLAFHKYKFVWAPGKIDFYQDGILIATHTKVVPSTPAVMMFNHWGTDNANWGGTATPGVDRYMFIRNFRFTPL